MPTDPNASDSENADSQVNGSKRDRSLPDDSKERQKGLNKTIDKLMRKNAELQAQYEQEVVSRTEAESALRVQLADAQKTLKTKEQELETERKTREQKEQELLKQTAKSSADKLIAEKYPNLVQDHLAGDLKIRSDFADDATYEAYLDRQNKRSGGSASDKTPENTDKKGEAKNDSTSLREAASGATPAGGGRIMNETPSDPKTAAELDEAFASLDPHDPQYRQKYNALMKRMDAIIFPTSARPKS